MKYVLFDADNTLYPSEEPAGEVSTTLMNQYLEALGDERRYTPENIKELTRGRNFRIVARELAAQRDGVGEETIERWAEREIDAVTDRLREALSPEEEIRAHLEEIQERAQVAVVTSSATRRLAGGLETSRLEEIFPPGQRFSADDSLEYASTKPDPDVYQHALRELRVQPEEAVAVEDSTTGTTAAVQAGLLVIGITHHLPPERREERRRELLDAGATCVVESWNELRELLTSNP